MAIELEAAGVERESAGASVSMEASLALVRVVVAAAVVEVVGISVPGRKRKLVLQET